jgi:hypothetical protein
VLKEVGGAVGLGGLLARPGLISLSLSVPLSLSLSSSPEGRGFSRSAQYAPSISLSLSLSVSLSASLCLSLSLSISPSRAQWVRYMCSRKWAEPFDSAVSYRDPDLMNTWCGVQTSGFRIPKKNRFPWREAGTPQHHDDILESGR